MEKGSLSLLCEILLYPIFLFMKQFKFLGYFALQFRPKQKDEVTSKGSGSVFGKRKVYHVVVK